MICPVERRRPILAAIGRRRPHLSHRAIRVRRVLHLSHLPALRRGLVALKDQHPVLHAAFELDPRSANVNPYLPPLLGDAVVGVEALPGVRAIRVVLKDHAAIQDVVHAAGRLGPAGVHRHDVPLAHPEIELPMLRRVTTRRRLRRRRSLGGGSRRSLGRGVRLRKGNNREHHHSGRQQHCSFHGTKLQKPPLSGTNKVILGMDLGQAVVRKSRALLILGTKAGPHHASHHLSPITALYSYCHPERSANKREREEKRRQWSPERPKPQVCAGTYRRNLAGIGNCELSR